MLRYFLDVGARPSLGSPPYTQYLQTYLVLRQGSIETLFEPCWHDFMDAVLLGDEEDVAEYLAAGVDVNKNSSQFLFGEFPLGCYKNVSFRDLASKCTALQAAVENCQLGMVNILVRNNADANAAIYSQHGWSVLKIAYTLRQTDIIAELLQHGAVINPTPDAQRMLVEGYHAWRIVDATPDVI